MLKNEGAFSFLEETRHLKSFTCIKLIFWTSKLQLTQKGGFLSCQYVLTNLLVMKNSDINFNAVVFLMRFIMRSNV